MRVCCPTAWTSLKHVGVEFNHDLTPIDEKKKKKPFPPTRPAPLVMEGFSHRLQRPLLPVRRRVPGERRRVRWHYFSLTAAVCFLAPLYLLLGFFFFSKEHL